MNENNKSGGWDERDTSGASSEPMSDEALVTAYALGELDGAENAAQRARVEALAATDAGVRDEIERIREVADELQRELLTEGGRGPAPALTGDQRRAIENALAGPPVRRLRSWLLAAASIAAVGLILWQLRPGDRTGTPTANPTGPVAMGEKDELRDELGQLNYVGDGSDSTGAGRAGVPPSEANAPFVARESGGSMRGLNEAEGMLVDMDNQRTALQERVEAADALDAKTKDLELKRNSGVPDASVIVTKGDASGTAGGASAPAATSSRITGPAEQAGVYVEEEPVRQDFAQLGYVGAGGDAPVHPFMRLAKKRKVANEVAEGVREPEDRRQPDPLIYWPVQPTPGTEYYAPIVEQGFASPIREPLSTFSIDVDTASYANVRRFLNNGQLPPADAVRIEELVNYFEYDYPAPDGEAPFATHVAVSESPWAKQHRLVRIGIKGREVPAAERAASNLVFLLDVSGSMDQPDKLPLLVASFKLLTGQLDERDRVAIVTYAGAAGLQLEPTRCDGPGRQKVLDCLDNLRAGGSTAGAAGIQLAYQYAGSGFLEGGTNRVLLATDGDFNVGITDRDSLQRLIETSAKSGVFLSVLGFGEGNLKDGTAELLADKGNGNYSYIDSLDEGRRVLVHEMGGTLVTIAKDVKIQVEFNPGKVGAYRLIGYENRALAAEDFNNDKKDAGEIGAGHTITALYEVVPVGVELVPGVDALKYQAPAPASAAAPQFVESPDLLTVKLRWKLPESDTSTKLELPVRDGDGTLAQAGPDASFSAAVAAFGMLLRGSGAAGDASWDSVIALAEQGRGADRDGYRAEFIRLAKVAKGLAPR